MAATMRMSACRKRSPARCEPINSVCATIFERVAASALLLTESRNIALPGGVLTGRRRLLTGAGALAATLACGGCTPEAPLPPAPAPAPMASGQSLLDDL